MNPLPPPTATPPDQGLLQRYATSLTGVFGPPSRVLVRGSGATVWDSDGRQYTDLLAGIAVNVLGHAHPRLVQAVTEQAATLGHISNLFTSQPQIDLAERLLELAQAPAGSTVFFANSGSEANEAAFKLARRHGAEHPGEPQAGEDPPRRHRILALDHAFHGRTMGSLALTWKQAYREPFAPLPGGVEHLPGGDLAALEAAMDSTVAALIVEPVQGESGVHGWPAGYLSAARELCTRHGALLIFDEVQSGVGRTGTWFAHQNPEVTGMSGPDAAVQPDAMTLAKGLGGGFPIGALISFGADVSALLQPGQHGTTFGGNPLATAAGLAVLQTVEEEGLLPHAQELGADWARALQALPEVTAVRQYGLLLGVDLAPPAHTEVLPDGGLAPAVVRAGLDGATSASPGWILNATGLDTLRLAPPLILTAEQAHAFVAALPGLIHRALSQTPSQETTA